MSNQTQWHQIHAAALGIQFVTQPKRDESSSQPHQIPQQQFKLRADWRLVYGRLPRLEMRWFQVFAPRDRRTP